MSRIPVNFKRILNFCKKTKNQKPKAALKPERVEGIPVRFNLEASLFGVFLGVKKITIEPSHRERA